ncbi:MAG: large-conductance mechanosensitive channel protein MscL [Bacteroidales bacterium]|jgi:large conductance mechanosensitive channel|nr:large-conductance mechanosensitive channel protein MscL [Bacteroidales bacterium]
MAKSKFWSEFKEFAMKGNVIDMAVGVVIGGAFGKIVTSLVSDIIMPLVGALCGGLNFTDWKWVVKQAVVEGGEVVKPEVALTWGNFLQVIFDFIIIALCIFAVIKGINKAKALSEKKEEAPAEPEAPAPKPDDVVLLEEIRDLLKNK